MHKKGLALLKVHKIVSKKVPFPQKSSQYSALKSVPKKCSKKVRNKVLKKVLKKVLALFKAPKIVPKKVLFPKKVPKKVPKKAYMITADDDDVDKDNIIEHIDNIDNDYVEIVTEFYG